MSPVKEIDITFHCVMCVSLELRFICVILPKVLSNVSQAESDRVATQTIKFTSLKTLFVQSATRAITFHQFEKGVCPISNASDHNKFSLV